MWTGSDWRLNCTASTKAGEAMNLNTPERIKHRGWEASAGKHWRFEVQFFRTKRVCRGPNSSQANKPRGKALR